MLMVLYRLSSVDIHIFILTLLLVYAFLEHLCDGAPEVLLLLLLLLLIIIIIITMLSSSPPCVYGDSQGVGRPGDRISVVAKFFTPV
jgi:hypothetical protein